LRSSSHEIGYQQRDENGDYGHDYHHLD